MGVKNRVTAVPAGAIDTAVLDGSYEQLNAGGLPEACFLLRVINDSDIGLEISYDGTTQHDFVSAKSVAYLPAQSNSQPNNNVALFPKGLVVWVNGTDGTGVVYLAGYYQVAAN